MALFNRRKRDVEPILAISVVVLLVASGAVVSLSIFGSYTDDDDLEVALGREIGVSYTGSLYDYYDKKGALIFDTNIEKHADNDDYSFIGGFDKKKFDELVFTYGGREVLSEFESALHGHKAGETVRVKIPLGKGYESKNMERPDSFKLQKIESMSVKEFESIYEDEYVLNGSHPIDIETIYGWDAIAWFDTAKSLVNIEHKPTEGEEYILNSNELNVHGNVNVIVEFDGDDNENIVCKMVLDLIDEDEDYMLWVKTHSDNFYIYGESETEGFYKVTDSPAAEGTIYFVITIESVSKRAD